MEEVDEILGISRKFIWMFIGFVLIVSAISTGFYFLRTTSEKVVVQYEEFFEIQSTCKKISSDICSLQSVPEDDKMFSRISKNERLTALRNQLHRWVNEYNAKSKMITRTLWKSSDLPYNISE